MTVDIKHASAYRVGCDPDISLKAKGIYFYLYLRHGEHVTLERMTEDFQEGIASIRRAVKELEDAGHLKRVRIYPNGHAAYDWFLK